MPVAQYIYAKKQKRRFSGLRHTGYHLIGNNRTFRTITVVQAFITCHPKNPCPWVDREKALEVDSECVDMCIVPNVITAFSKGINWSQLATNLNSHVFFSKFIRRCSNLASSRLTIVSREAKKKQAVCDEQVCYLQVAPLWN